MSKVKLRATQIFSLLQPETMEITRRLYSGHLPTLRLRKQQRLASGDSQHETHCRARWKVGSTEAGDHLGWFSKCFGARSCETPQTAQQCGSYISLSRSSKNISNQLLAGFRNPVPASDSSQHLPLWTAPRNVPWLPENRTDLEVCIFRFTLLNWEIHRVS